MAEKIRALWTPRGYAVVAGELSRRLGGQAGLRRVLNALTTREVPQPGRPRAQARQERHAYEIRRNARNARGEPVPDVIFFPRMVVGRLGDLLAPTPPPRAVIRADGEGNEIRPPPLAQPLYDYQTAAVRFAVRRCREAGSVYLDIQTGLGKSRIAIAAAVAMGPPFFVVVPTQPIREGFIKDFNAMFPALRARQYVNPPKGSKRAAVAPGDCEMVVGIVNTVRAKEPGFFAGYNTVVLDEAHEYGSPKSHRAMWLAEGAPHRVYISATPAEANNGLDRSVFQFAGRPVPGAEIPGFDVGAVDFRGRIREVEYAGDPEYCQPQLTAAGTLSAVLTVGRLVADPARVRLVVAEVERLYNLHLTADGATRREYGLLPPGADDDFPDGKFLSVMVFAEHRDYLPQLAEALRARFAGDVEVMDDAADAPDAVEAADAPDTDAGGLDVALDEILGGDSDSDGGGPGAPGNPIIPGAPQTFDEILGIDGEAPVSATVLRGTTSRKQARADLAEARTSRVVLTTYGYSRRGVSITDMNAAVFASPRRGGMTQILGRIIRRGSDESILRHVVDIKDTRSPLKAQSSNRRRAYKKKGWPIFKVRVDHAQVVEGFRPPEDEAAVWAPDGAEPPDGAAPAGAAEDEAHRLLFA